MLDDSTDVIYQVTAPAAGGLVSTRDFVSARHYSVRDGCFWSGGASVVHPDAPSSDKHVRGENGPGCMVARPIPGVADRCIFQWVINTRLNGWLPQRMSRLLRAVTRRIETQDPESKLEENNQVSHHLRCKLQK
ncbi:hypothetical protein C0J52_07443 [Blattella germanica]|nr:hypothetical protein C0J52_07443 [Blattella germanica]